ncbi:MAG: putative sensor histidine kinase with a response regulator receiver domain [Moraxellaceae bacterium]|jgi:PAS domain S-box-containing protein|nr:putative sensor histidine kinase with a response regulator receiver domain [Moraxellaceae bacterium]
MARATESRSRTEARLRVAVVVLLGVVLLWDMRTSALPTLGIWYAPIMILAHLQGSRTFVSSITLLAICAPWLGCFLGQAPTPPYNPLSHCISGSLALLAVHAGLYHHFLRCEKERMERERLFRRQHGFETLAESLPLHIWTATPDGKVDIFGQRFIEETGRSRGEIRSDWSILLHPDDRERAIARWSRSLTTGHNYENEVRFRDAQGRYAWYLVRAVPERDAQGGVMRWLGSAQNINHIHVLRAQAQALAERLHNALEGITDALFAVDDQYRLTYINAKAAAVLGLERNQLLGRSISDHLKGDGNNLFMKLSRMALREQRFVHVQEWYAPKKMWLDIRLYPFKDGLTVYFLDITRQREEEMELRLLRTGVSRLNDIIMITEAEPIDEPGPRIIFINEAFERITGYRPSDMIGQSPRFLQGPETQRDELDRIRQAMVRREPVRAQVINYKKSGQPVWLEIDIAPIADADGRYTHFVSVERDITESKAMAHQLQHAQRMETVGLLTGGMAHDFNNLLTVVLGNADMLAESLADDADLAPLARMIVQAADHGASLVRSLLAFARRQSLIPGPVAIDTMVQELRPILEASLTHKHQLVLQVEEPLWVAYVDRGQLESALLNLVINARDAMPDSGRLTIALANVTLDEAQAPLPSDVSPGDYIQMAVTDTGTGIAPHDMDRIFEPFFSTKATGRGSGLGLSSVFGFIKQSGGHIAVHSELGVGSTFRLYLPRSLEKRSSETIATAPVVTEYGTDHCILVVEDDDGIRRLAIRYLEQAGYRTQQAANGDAALALLQQGVALDLLFTDVIMPGALSGPALARAAHRLLPTLPVLYASGFAEKSQLLPEELGENEHFLAKPYRREQLLSKVAHLIGHAHTPSRTQ